MTSFVTLILGIAYGTWTVELSASPQVARIDLYVDGKLASEIAPPWKTEVDLGHEITPREMVAVARGVDGARLGEARQWINRAKAYAEARFVLERDAAGRATRARLVWSCPTSPKPKAIDVSFDGIPIDAPDPSRIPIPAYSSGSSHVLLADLTFDGGVVATAVASLGGGAKKDVERELTAFPVRLSGTRKRLPDPARLRGWFQVDGHDLAVAAVEKGTAEVVFISSGLAFKEFARLAGRESVEIFLKQDESGTQARSRTVVYRVRSAGKRRSRSKELDRDTVYSFLSPAPQATPGSAAETRLFPISEAFTSRDGPFLDVNGWAVFTPGDSLPRVAEAVAVSGLSATRRERRRAVVLLLGRGDLEASDFDAGRAARYLARLGVPLHVWRLAPPESPVAPGWPKGLDVTTTEGLQAAFRTLREDLAAQRVIWLEGRVDPSKVEVSPVAQGMARALNGQDAPLPDRGGAPHLPRTPSE